MKMTRACRNCGSTAVDEVSAELSFERGRATVPVYTLGKMSVCLTCGFGEYLVPKEPLAHLRQGEAAPVKSSAPSRTRSKTLSIASWLKTTPEVSDKDREFEDLLRGVFLRLNRKSATNFNSRIQVSGKRKAIQ